MSNFRVGMHNFDNFSEGTDIYEQFDRGIIPISAILNLFFLRLVENLYLYLLEYVCSFIQQFP